MSCAFVFSVPLCRADAVGVLARGRMRLPDLCYGDGTPLPRIKPDISKRSEICLHMDQGRKPNFVGLIRVSKLHSPLDASILNGRDGSDDFV